MKTIVVTIGRNVKSEQMSCYDWVEFKQDVNDALAYTFGDEAIIQRPYICSGASGQLGIWEGVVEQAAAWVVLVPEHGPHNFEECMAELCYIAYDYNQEAIGWISGDATLIEGRPF